MLEDAGLSAHERDAVARQAHVHTARGLLGASARLLRHQHTTPAALRRAAAAEAPCFQPLGAVRPLRRVATPFARLDAVLGGGLAAGRVTEVVGAAGSGKTMLCHALAAAVATHAHARKPHRRRGGVLFIDATGSCFSPHALALWLRHIIATTTAPTGTTRGESDKETEGMLGGVQVVRVLDADRLVDVLEAVLLGGSGDDSTGNTAVGREVELVVVDGLTALFAPLVGSGLAGSIGSAVMGRAARLLRNVARQHRAAVVVTNWLVSGGAAGLLQPALGEQWRAAVHTRLLVQRGPSGPNTAAFTVTNGLHANPQNTVAVNLIPSLGEQQQHQAQEAGLASKQP